MAPSIKLICLDVDGVLTDGRIIYTDSGEEMKSFHVHDSQGLMLCHLVGMKTVVVTGRISVAAERRCREMRVNYFCGGQFDKYKYLKNILELENIGWNEVAYIGDDLIDYVSMESVAMPIAVQNAVEAIKKIAKHVTVTSGGHGAVREAIEYLLKSEGLYDQAVHSFFKKLSSMSEESN